MGSTTHIIDKDGEVQNRYEYDVWGNLTLCEEKISNRFKFTGQQFDPITQQYYLRARFYNPVIAWFTQEDTYQGDRLNLYAYCANNPVYYVDPTGNEKDTLGEQYRQQEIDNYVANKRAGLDTGDVPPEIAAQGNATIKTLEAYDKQLGYSNQDTAAGEINRSANRVDAPQAEISHASRQSNPVHNAAQYDKLKTYYQQAEKYGNGSIKELPDGRMRFYEERKLAKLKMKWLERDMRENGIRKQEQREISMKQWNI